MLSLPLLQSFEISVDRIRIASRLLDGRKQQFPALLQPNQQTLRIRAAALAEPGQNDVVELEALGFMNRHQLKPSVRVRVSLGKQKIQDRKSTRLNSSH